MGVTFKGFPLSIANGFASRGSPSPSGWDSPQGVSPLSTANGIRFRGSPSPSEWIHLKGFPLSSANGIRFMGVPFSKANGIRLMGFPLSRGPLLQVNEIHLKGLPSPQRMGFASRSPLLQSEWDSPPGGPPYPGVPFSK